MRCAAWRWAEARDGECEVWIEHAPVLAAWGWICDQWHLAPSGHRHRLDWPAAAVLLDAAGVVLDAALAESLREMEWAARETWWDAARRGQ